MSAVDSLEKSLDGVFGSKSPVKLPENGKKAIVQWLPWISVILGVLTLWGAYALYHWARVANDVVNYVNELSRLYGGSAVTGSRWSVGIWVSLIVAAGVGSAGGTGSIAGVVGSVDGAGGIGSAGAPGAPLGTCVGFSSIILFSPFIFITYCITLTLFRG